MATDEKVDALTELDEQPADDDVLYIVDVSEEVDADKDKFIETSNLLLGPATDIATNVTAIALNTTHRGSSGVDHGYIDQDVKVAATPTFATVKLSAGTILVTPEAGLIEYDGYRFHIMGTNRRVISRACCSLITPVEVVNSTTETVVWTGTLAANTATAYKNYVVKAFGKFSTHDAAALVTVRVRLGGIDGTVIVELAGTAGIAADDPWHAKAFFTCRTVGEEGTLSSHGDIDLDGTNLHSNVSSTVVNTTTETTLVVTVEWAAANAGNTITIDQGFLEVLN